jgi:hypothetical protein
MVASSVILAGDAMEGGIPTKLPNNRCESQGIQRAASTVITPIHLCVLRGFFVLITLRLFSNRQTHR